MAVSCVGEPSGVADIEEAIQREREREGKKESDKLQKSVKAFITIISSIPHRSYLACKRE